MSDCSKALELNSSYMKALFRRSKAYENMDQKMQCLEGKQPFLSMNGKAYIRPRSWAKKGQATLALPSSKFHRAPRPTQGAPRPIISKPLIYIYLQPMYTRLFSRSHVSIKSIQFLYTMSKEPVSNSPLSCCNHWSHSLYTEWQCW